MEFSLVFIEVSRLCYVQLNTSTVRVAHDFVLWATKKTSVALACDRTTPTERPPLVDEVSANFLGIESIAWFSGLLPG
jgi:hypothetical protein